jgi:hypothetical protein
MIFVLISVKSLLYPSTRSFKHKSHPTCATAILFIIKLYGIDK